MKLKGDQIRWCRRDHGSHGTVYFARAEPDVDYFSLTFNRERQPDDLARTPIQYRFTLLGLDLNSEYGGNRIINTNKNLAS